MTVLSGGSGAGLTPGNLKVLDKMSAWEKANLRRVDPDELPVRFNNVYAAMTTSGEVPATSKHQRGVNDVDPSDVLRTIISMAQARTASLQSRQRSASQRAVTQAAQTSSSVKGLKDTVRGQSTVLSAPTETPWWETST